MNPVAHAYLDLHDEDGGLSAGSRHRGRALVLLLTLALTSFTLLVAASPAAADHLDSDSLIRTFGDDDSELGDDDDGDDDNSTGSAGDSGDNGASTSGATEGTSVGTGGDTTGKGDPCAPGDTDDTSNDGNSSDGDTDGGDSNDTSGDGNSGDGDTAGDDSDDTSGDGNSHDGDSGDDGDSVDGGDEAGEPAREACAPGIDVDKSAAESSVDRGGTINYTIVVRNTGNAPLTVTPTDQACTGFDGAVFQLAPGASKTLTCSHVAGSADGTSYRNEACATGVASGGQTAGDCDDAVTPITDPPPAAVTTTTTAGEQAVLGDQLGGVSDPGGQLVLGERIIPGRARLIGATGCRGKAFNVRVVGRQMATVTFRLDGKVVKTVRRAGTRATLRVNPLRLSLGVHRLVATVRFNASSRTRARTLRLSFQRCARALQAPRFTG